MQDHEELSINVRQFLTNQKGKSGVEESIRNRHTTQFSSNYDEEAFSTTQAHSQIGKNRHLLSSPREQETFIRDFVIKSNS